MIEKINPRSRIIHWTAPAILSISIFSIILSSATFAATLQSVTTPWIRVNNPPDHMRLDPKGRFVAFTGTTAQPSTGLSVLDLKTHNIYEVTKQPVGLSFFWAPDGFRLFYREMYRALAAPLKIATAIAPSGETSEAPTSDAAPFFGSPKKNSIRSVLSAYDCALHRSVVLDELPFQTGILTFDPRDLRLHLMSIAGIHTKRISFPDERFARWQVARRTDSGKFIATQNGILWMTQGGSVMRRLDDDGSVLDSFDISPDGTSIAWATSKGRIYTSKNGDTTVFLSYGRDPRWHPEKPQLLFSGSRMVGDKAVNQDLKIADLKGSSRFLTKTQFVDERWPQWTPKADQIIYTISKTTDIYKLEFKQ